MISVGSQENQNRPRLQKTLVPGTKVRHEQFLEKEREVRKWERSTFLIREFQCRSEYNIVNIFVNLYSVVHGEEIKLYSERYRFLV